MFSIITIKNARRLAKFLSLLIYTFNKHHTKIIQTHLKESFKKMDDKKCIELSKKVWENLMLGIIELACLPREIKYKNIQNVIRFTNLDFLSESRQKGKGAIIVAGHLGNWELVGIALAKLGFTINSIARPLDNKYVDMYLDSIRASTGQSIIKKFGAVNDMLNSLKQNQFLAILIDQNVRRGGVFVDFFGKKASTVKSPAILSIRTGAPIIPIEIFREFKDKQIIHRAIFHKPIYPQDFASTKDKIFAITQLITKKLEDFIRNHPEQWFWFHQRWKTQPPKIDVVK
jgi:KDO2-lipid IV(A) lauroyltransferase